MAAKNQKSSTLPSSLRHGVAQTEENEGFFTKLKKKLKLKKGKYHVDVNTGECENISTVSFRKRESREVVEDDCPWKLRDPKSEERSPSIGKKALSRQSERTTLGIKVKERKYSNPETGFIRAQNIGSSDLNDFQRSSLGNGGKVSKSTNEYSPLTYDTKENSSGERSRKLRESSVTNECVICDDSAIDLDGGSGNRPNVPRELNYDPGYEKLPPKGSKLTKSLEETRSPLSDFDPNYESVDEVKRQIKGSKSKDSVDFDPNYESVDDVKDKMRKSGLISPGSLMSEPGYQSIKDVKRETNSNDKRNTMRPAKTYNVNKSIESLDEPGYESLNDVKRKMGQQHMHKSVSNGKIKQKDRVTSPDEKDEMNDSAIGSVTNTGGISLRNPSHKRSKSGDEVFAKKDGQGLMAFTQMAVSLTGFAQALTESGRSKDSGFDSKETNLNFEQEENTKVNIKGKEEIDPTYSTVNKSQTNTTSSAPTSAPSAPSDCIESKIIPEPSGDGYDSDVELMLDPGYAECADAIKGIIPGFSIYSDGSGSKISSCTSLDLSAEDFILEPGYAECADAIKTGAIKKISLSHERLVDHSEHNCEIYANPQILFRKRSKMLEEVKGETGEKSLAERDLELKKEHEASLALEHKQKKKDKKNKKAKELEKPLEAPPLPARNYSLYLENEEAEKTVNEVLENIGINDDNGDQVLDDAFDDPMDNETVVKSDFKSDDKVVHDGNDSGAMGSPFSEITVETSAVTAVAKVAGATGVYSSVETVGTSTVTAVAAGPNICVVCGKVINNINDTLSIETVNNTTNTSNPEHVISNTLEDNLASKNDLVNKNLCEKCKLKKAENEAKLIPAVSGNNATVDLTDESNNDKNTLISVSSDLCKNKAVEKEIENVTECAEQVCEKCNDRQDNDEVLHVTVEGGDGLKTVLTVLEKQDSIEIKKKREIGKKKISQEMDKDFEVVSMETNDIENSPGVNNDLNHSDDDVKVVNDNCKCEILSSNLDTKVKDGCIVQIAASNERGEVSRCCMGGGSEIESDCTTSNSYQPYMSSTANENVCCNIDTNNFLTVAVKMKTISIDSDSDLFNTEELPKLEIRESDLESAFDSSDSSANMDISVESAGIEKLTQKLNTETICVQQNEKDEIRKNTVDVDEVAIDKGGTFNSISEILQTSEQKDRDKNSEETKPNVSQITVSEAEDENIDASDKCSSDCETDKVQINSDKCGESSMNVIDHSLSDLVENSNSEPETNVNDSADHDNESLEVSSDKVNYVSENIVNDNCSVKSETENENLTLERKVICVVDGDGGNNLHGVRALQGNIIHDVADLNQYPEIAQCSVHANDDYNLVDSAIECNDEGIVDTCNIEDVVDSNQQKEVMHLIYEKEHPNLYEDSEPTHMSLQEAMGLKPSYITRSVSDCSGQGLSSSNFSDPFVMQNIPDEYSSIDSGAVALPPRTQKPSSCANSSQSNSKVSFSSRVGWSSANVPTEDDNAVLLKLCESGHSHDGSPPVIPPRMPLKEKNSRTTKRPVSYSQDFMESMRQLKDCGWYWGPLSWEEAELKLAKKPEGTFLVRDSSDEHYILSLSFKNQGRVHHTRIEHHKGHFSFWSQPDSHGKSTIKEFIEQCVENSRNGRFLYFIRPSGPGSPPMPIQLLHPVSRFIQMRSLQHMSRFRILQLVRRDHIDLLPVPKRIKQYLNEAQYYVEYLED
ncbi:negative regulation of STAT cascade [Mactra antiquata]